MSTALRRSAPTVSWLDPKLRTTIDFNLSAGETTQIGQPTTITNVFHVGAERDEYFSPRGYYLQVTSFDHDFSQGLVLQQIYGGGVGATLLKRENHQFDVSFSRRSTSGSNPAAKRRERNTFSGFVGHRRQMVFGDPYSQKKTFLNFFNL